MPAERVQLRQLLDAAERDSGGTRAGYEQALTAHGVRYEANTASGTGRVSGYRYALHGHTDSDGHLVWFKGSQIGKAYTWTHTQQRLHAAAPTPAPDVVDVAPRVERVERVEPATAAAAPAGTPVNVPVDVPALTPRQLEDLTRTLQARRTLQDVQAAFPAPFAAAPRSRPTDVRPADLWQALDHADWTTWTTTPAASASPPVDVSGSPASSRPRVSPRALREQRPYFLVPTPDLQAQIEAARAAAATAARYEALLRQAPHSVRLEQAREQLHAADAADAAADSHTNRAEQLAEQIAAQARAHASEQAKHATIQAEAQARAARSLAGLLGRSGRPGRQARLTADLEAQLAQRAERLDSLRADQDAARAQAIHARRAAEQLRRDVGADPQEPTPAALARLAGAYERQDRVLHREAARHPSGEPRDRLTALTAEARARQQQPPDQQQHDEQLREATTHRAQRTAQDAVRQTGRRPAQPAAALPRDEPRLRPQRPGRDGSGLGR